MRKRPICLMCIFFIIGIWLLDCLEIAPRIREERTTISYTDTNETIQVVGSVYQIQEKETYCYIYLKKAVLLSNSQNIKLNKIIVKMDTSAIQIGNTVKVTGALTSWPVARNPGGFDQRAYYRSKEIYALLEAENLDVVEDSYNWFLEKLRNIKGTIQNSFSKITSERIASILSAMLLGDKGSMDQETKVLYQMAGITHILTISGLHISILGIGIYEWLKRIGATIPIASCISITLLISYGILTGGSPATVRAIIMFLVSMGAKVFGKTYDMLCALAVAAMLLLLDTPAYLYDCGFLLSFMAVFAVAEVLPIMEQFFGKSKNSVIQGLIASETIFLVTLPVVLFYFYEIPVYALVLNLLVLPSLGLVLVSGLLGGGITSMIVGMGKLSLGVTLGQILILPATGLIHLYNMLGEMVSKFPYATLILGKPKKWVIVLYYLGLTAIIWYMNKQKDCKKPSRGNKKLYGCLFLLILCSVFVVRKSSFSITNLDVGQGDCAVVESSNGMVLLVDGGSSSKKGTGAYDIIPYLKSQGIRTVEYLLLSHPDDDHMNGFVELLEMQATKQTSIIVKNLVMPSWCKGEEKVEELLELAKGAKVQVGYVKAGDIFEDDTMRIQILSPQEDIVVENSNAGSMVFRLEENGRSALFTGDMEENQEIELLEEVAACEYFKVSHHGSKSATSIAFLEQINPSVSVISCGARNRYGHPNKEIIERLTNQGSHIFYTMKGGALRFEGEKRGWSVSLFVNEKEVE